MGHKIDIKIISLRGNSGGIGTALFGVFTDRPDKPGISTILIFVKEMAYIVICCSYDRVKGKLCFRIEVYTVGIRVFVGVNNLVIISNQFQGYAQVGLKNFV